MCVCEREKLSLPHLVVAAVVVVAVVVVVVVTSPWQQPEG